jgi:Helicase conserved C-terminal domain/PLD-like domain
MPRIFDNIEQHLSPALANTLAVSYRADFCVGYFNLRGWRSVASYVDAWPGGEEHCCRLMIGMQNTPQEELREALSLSHADEGMDNPTAVRLKRKLALEFRRQLMLGAPSNEDEQGLRRLAQQLKGKKLVVKLHLRHRLHAKLYLLFRDDYNNPVTGYLGSSNLTLSGLQYQGELNVDVLEHDACKKLTQWFEDRWNDHFSLDISEELIQVIEESWAREEPLTPYEIYVKMAYHLAEEARAGLTEFTLPAQFRREMFEFQAAAVKIAARHLNRRGGVMIGDVVGLGKTLMASALASIFEEALGVSTLIICPRNLVKMWQGYVDKYGLRARVMSSGLVMRELKDVPGRFRIVLIDESHNLRNREGARYRAIKEYIDQTDSRCILLSATPYNKTYLDLSAQLRLFIDPDADLGIRPDALLREVGEIEFSKYQVSPTTLAAFERSEHADDWRELMRMYLVRRTRSFIKAHYALTDPLTGRKYLQVADGTRLPFPTRVPKTLKFPLRTGDKEDQYARLYSERVVNVINQLYLPRYGLGNYLRTDAEQLANAGERRVMANLSRAGKRLLGYCRTNLFKRLESGGQAFILSLDRHVLRNYIVQHALQNVLPVPVGTQNAEMLDPANNDADADAPQAAWDADGDDGHSNVNPGENGAATAFSPEAYRQRAAQVYALYQTQYAHNFSWLRPLLFRPQFQEELAEDSRQLIGILKEGGVWDAGADRKLQILHKLISRTHPDEKILIFTQFADTVDYLTAELKRRGLPNLEGVSGNSDDPTGLAWRFSPKSNGKELAAGQELRVLIATDVLSEGQNLQDAAIVVNYDLPWAIIRLVQRAGRVDRIGQTKEEILCYSFLPAEGVEQIIRLRARVQQRLHENAEVIGTDEQFFEGEADAGQLRDLYTEKSGALDDEADADVDLASVAYQIWRDATKDDPALAKKIEGLPNVVFSTRAHEPSAEQPEGVLVYTRTADDNDALAWVDREGRSVTQSQLVILRAAECTPETPAIPRHESHHQLVKDAVQLILQDQHTATGQLGRPSGARHRAYTRLKAYYDDLKTNAPMLASDELARAIDALLKYPLREGAKDILNRQLKAGITNDDLARLVTSLREDARLSVIPEEGEDTQVEPQIICSLGLFRP